MSDARMRRQVVAAVLAAVALLAVAAPLGVQAQGTVPDLSGMWQPRGDATSPPWQFTASDGLRTLDVTWSGSGAHQGLAGSFHGTLITQADGTGAYQGSFHVDEPDPNG